MGVYHYFSRIKKSKDLIVYESKVYPYVEVDYDKIRENTIGLPVEMLHTRYFKYTMKYMEDFGIYNYVDYSFFLNAVNNEYRVSYKRIDGKTYVVLFYPENILEVVDKILPNMKGTKHDANLDDCEINDMYKLKELLDEALKNDELIFSEIVW